MFRIRSDPFIAFVQHLLRHRGRTAFLWFSRRYPALLVSVLIKTDDMNTQRKSYAHDWLKCKSSSKLKYEEMEKGSSRQASQQALNELIPLGKMFFGAPSNSSRAGMMNWQRKKVRKEKQKPQRKRNCWLKESDQKYCESVRVIEWINCLNYPEEKWRNRKRESRGNTVLGLCGNKKGRSHRNLSSKNELRPRLKTSTTNTLFH